MIKIEETLFPLVKKYVSYFTSKQCGGCSWAQFMIQIHYLSLQYSFCWPWMLNISSARNAGQGISRQTMAMVMMVVGSCSFYAGYIYCNQHNFHPVETSLMRGVAVTLICFLLIRYQQLDFTFRSTHNLKWLLIRNSIMVVHNFAYNLSQFYLPLPIAITLGSISPIFVFIYDYLIYGITINKAQAIFLVVSIVGVTLTANGSYIITFFEDIDLDRSKFGHYQSKDPMVMAFASMGMVMVMAVHSYGVVLTKKLRGVQSAEINFIQGILIFYSAATLFPIAEAEHTYARMTFEDFMKALFFSGLPMTIGQLCYIGALVMSKNMGLITTLSFSSIIMGNLVSVLRYGEAVNYVSTIGSILIIVGIVFIVRLKDVPTVSVSNK